MSDIVVDQDPVKSAQKRLAAAQAAREATKAARAKAVEAEDIEREVNNLEALSAIEDEFGADRVARVDSNGGMVVVVYQPAMHRKLIEKMQKSITIALLKETVGPCVKYPSREKFAELVDEWPQTLVDAQNALVSLASVKEGAREGK